MARVTKSNIIEFQIKLLNWFSHNARQFPWRKSKLTQYEIIIAEILLQRTKAETISKFYRTFFLRFPNWRSLSDVDVVEIENIIKPIGLFSQKAKRLKSLAIEMEKRKGVLPRKREELENLPFMGQYIANSIELIIYKIPSPLLDVNMSRVLERYFGQRIMADIRFDPYLQNLAAKIVNHDKSKELNWAILDFAALVCRAAKPLCETCELRVKCLYFNQLND